MSLIILLFLLPLPCCTLAHSSSCLFAHARMYSSMHGVRPAKGPAQEPSWTFVHPYMTHERKESRPQWRRDAGILIHYDGHIYLTAQSIIKASCAIDVRYALRHHSPPPQQNLCIVSTLYMYCILYVKLCVCVHVLL